VIKSNKERQHSHRRSYVMASKRLAGSTVYNSRSRDTWIDEQRRVEQRLARYSNKLEVLR
jgi:hypothetical protein